VQWDDFQGVNRAYVLDLFDQFHRDPDSVDADTRELLTSLGTPPAFAGDSADPDSSPATAGKPAAANLGTAIRAFNLAQSIRRYGHLAAKIDPLEARPVGDSALELATHGVTPEDLRALPADLAPGPATAGARSLEDVIERLRGIYCSTTGYDFAHIFVADQRRWLRESVESVLVILRHRFGDRVAVTTNCSEPAALDCYAGLLNQAMMNLVTNALDAIEGSGAITITTGARDGWFELLVADTGSGIPQAIRERVFEPFFTTKAVGEGTGLGLYITYSIAKKHGGHVELVPREGGGTVAALRFPLGIQAELS